MQVRSNVTKDTLAGVVTLLQPAVPNLTATGLVAALKAYEPDSPGTRIERAPQFADKKTAADLLQVSTFTVQRMIDDGSLCATKVRGQWRIPLAAIEALAHV